MHLKDHEVFEASFLPANNEKLTRGVGGDRDTDGGGVDKAG